MKKSTPQKSKEVFQTSVDRHIQLTSPVWSFSLEGLAAQFDKHIQKSIPAYKETQDLIIDLSDYYTRRGGVVFDLGCSTGELTRRLAEKHRENENTFWIGLDKEETMIHHAKNNKNSLKNLDYIHCDFLDHPLQKSPFILICYTLQFMTLASRLALLKKVFASLEEGGACVVCEKVFEEDSRIQHILSSLYRSYKSKMGFSSSEILAKEFSLTGILTPLTRKQNFNFFENAGFEKITLLAKNLHFETYLLEK